MAENEVWGFSVEKSPAGKNIWPNELKWEATRRIREEGQSPGDIAAELGAHECLVRKWSVADRRRRGEKVHVEGPAFAAVNIEGEAQRAAAPHTPSSNSSGLGRILCGPMTIEFPLGISQDDLMKLMQVAGQLQ
jgi:transposase-like protein